VLGEWQPSNGTGGKPISGQSVIASLGANPPAAIPVLHVENNPVPGLLGIRRGFVYILINAAMRDDLVKIGKTERTPKERARELSAETGVPGRFHVAYEEELLYFDEAERAIHARLAEFRYNKNREFFLIPLKDAIQVVEEVARHYRDRERAEIARLGAEQKRLRAIDLPSTCSQAIPCRAADEYMSEGGRSEKSNQLFLALIIVFFLAVVPVFFLFVWQKTSPDPQPTSKSGIQRTQPAPPLDLGRATDANGRENGLLREPPAMPAPIEAEHNPEAEQKAKAIRSLEDRLSVNQKDLRAVERQLEESKYEEERLLPIWNKPMHLQDAVRVRQKMKQIKSTIAELEQKRDRLAQDEKQLIAQLEEAREAGP
jgi:hypothetical protein